MKRSPAISTVREHLAWSYANLAAAHAALQAGAPHYRRVDYMIRARLYRGLTSGVMRVGSLVDDERVKYAYPKSCCYCGAVAALQMDHLIPRVKGGVDAADNLVWACRSCNASKRDLDVLRWLAQKGRAPAVLLLRRYLKLVMGYCAVRGLLDLPLHEAASQPLPFDLMALPYRLEDLQAQVLWVQPVATA